MKYQIKCVVGIIVFFIFHATLHSQSTYTIGQLISDVQQQRYDDAVRNGQDILNDLEKNYGTIFSDDDYVGIIGLLSTAYISNGNYDLADGVLSHAIDFLTASNNNSEIPILYWLRGTLYFQLADYYNAEAYMSEALNMIDVEKVGAEYYAVLLSTLSSCYRSLEMLNEAKLRIDEALAYIDESSFNNSNIASINQKASAVYYDLGLFDAALQYAEKAYALTKNDENNIAGYYNSAYGLAAIYTNQCDYQKALEILHQIEKKQIVDLKKATLYQDIYQDYYYLNKERETAQYAKLCSDMIIQNILNYFFQLPLRDTERLWYNDALQLRVNMGVLDKFPKNDELVGMCYNNVLFVKTLTYEHSSLIKQLANDKQSEKTLDDIQALKERIFAGADTLFYELDLHEKVLLNQLKGSSIMNNYKSTTWKDVQRALKKGECAVEMISYVGFPATENEEKNSLMEPLF